MMPTRAALGALAVNACSGASVTFLNAIAINDRIARGTMPDSELAQQMRADWNQRALEDAYYYVALGGRGQDDEDFFASADTVVRALEEELKRFPPGDRRARK